MLPMIITPSGKGATACLGGQLFLSWPISCEVCNHSAVSSPLLTDHARKSPSHIRVVKDTCCAFACQINQAAGRHHASETWTCGYCTVCGTICPALCQLVALQVFSLPLIARHDPAALRNSANNNEETEAFSAIAAQATL